MDGDAEPPIKRAKSDLLDTGSQEWFATLVNDCYAHKFKSNQPPNSQQPESDSTDDEIDFQAKLEKIRKTLENVKNSKDISFGGTKCEKRINWAKCLNILLSDGPHNSPAISIICEKFYPGAGVIMTNLQ